MRTLGIAATLALALALLLPIAVTVGGAFLDLDWYGQRSEGAALQAPAELFRYVLHFWAARSAPRRSWRSWWCRWPS